MIKLPLNTNEDQLEGKPIISVALVIGSRNRPQMLTRCVEAVLAGEIVPTELIIVDQSDQPNQRLTNLTTDRQCEVRYLWTQAVGLCRANNVGVVAAKSDFIAFTHDDAQPPPTWFGALTRALIEAGPGCVVTGQVLASDNGTPGGFAPTVKTGSDRAVYQGRLGMQDVLCPLNMAMPRSALTQVSGFDARLGPGTPFPAAEDNDLGFRLLEAGYRIVYAPQAQLYHLAWRTPDEFFKLRWAYGRGQGAFYTKHMHWQDWYMQKRLVIDLGRHLWNAVCRIRKERRRAYGDLVFTAALLSGACEWLLKARKQPAQ